MERSHGLALGVLLPLPPADDAVALHPQPMAQQQRIAQLSHERLRELVEGVREHRHLEAPPCPRQKVRSARQGAQLVDHGPDGAQRNVVFRQHAKPHRHQVVVDGDVPGGFAQRVDAGAARHGLPDLGHEHAFEVEAENVQTAIPPGGQRSVALCEATDAPAA